MGGWNKKRPPNDDFCSGWCFSFSSNFSSLPIEKLWTSRYTQHEEAGPFQNIYSDFILFYFFCRETGRSLALRTNGAAQENISCHHLCWNDEHLRGRKQKGWGQNQAEHPMGGAGLLKQNTPKNETPLKRTSFYKNVARHFIYDPSRPDGGAAFWEHSRRLPRRTLAHILESRPTYCHICFARPTGCGGHLQFDSTPKVNQLRRKPAGSFATIHPEDCEIFR